MSSRPRHFGYIADRRKADPTPAEIRERCLEIRSTSTPGIERIRRGADDEGCLSIPVTQTSHYAELAAM